MKRSHLSSLKIFKKRTEYTNYVSNIYIYMIFEAMLNVNVITRKLQYVNKVQNTQSCLIMIFFYYKM